MSSKKKRKSPCPFNLLVRRNLQRGKRASDLFHKDRADVLAASDQGSCFEQEKLTVLDEEENWRQRQTLANSHWEPNSQESLQELGGWTIVAGDLQENLLKSVSYRFCHTDVTLLENVSAKCGFGSCSGWGGGYSLNRDETNFRLPPGRGTFFRLQIYKRVGISQVEV